MTRIWMAFGVVVLLILWWVFARTIALLVILLIVAAGVWGWWEVRALKKVMRTPPDA